MSRLDGQGRGSAVGVVPEPRADDDREKARLLVEAERRVEVLPVVGLEADVLARHRVKQPSDHRRGDPPPAVGRGGPDVEQVRIADAVGEEPRHPDDPDFGREAFAYGFGYIKGILQALETGV